ncbi:MAG: hypothetical protein H7138_13685 [Myxococcales bacterium]|nr:hypothetical protein [Myxococcales bacterium]
MKSLIVMSALLFGACSHQNKDATTPSGSATSASGAGAEDPMVDPTLPSWAPRSCRVYHAAVVKLVGCEGVAQEARDSAKAKYDADHAKWQAMQDQEQAALDAVGQGCTDDAASVRAQLTDACK